MSTCMGDTVDNVQPNAEDDLEDQTGDDMLCHIYEPKPLRYSLPTLVVFNELHIIVELQGCNECGIPTNSTRICTKA
jgi:hypothetical protein